MPLTDQMRTLLTRNLARCGEEISAAAKRSGREASAVRLLVVTKSVPPDVIRLLLEMGVHDVGENRVQQLTQRAEEIGYSFAEGGAPRWHMIGHLQRNKVKPLLEVCRTLHSLDSLRLAQELEAQAVRADAVVEVFVEVNVAGEAAKTGAGEQSAVDVAEFAAKAPHLRVLGLMTMAPLDAPGAAARPFFARLRELRDAWLQRGILPPTARELSMGMSGDYVAAVEEGATWVRLGSTLFEGLRDPGAAYT